MRWSDVVPRSWRLGDLAGGTLAADADALTAAIDALIENAVKHRPSQRTRPSPRARSRRGTLEIQVADGGRASRRGRLQRIFTASPARTGAQRARRRRRPGSRDRRRGRQGADANRRMVILCARSLARPARSDMAVSYQVPSPRLP